MRISTIEHFRNILLACSLFAAPVAYGQDSYNNIEEDTLFRRLKEVVIVANASNQVNRLSEVEGTSVFAGKKSERLLLPNLDASLVNNNARQAFAKIPGLHVWESDGSGIQISVGSRGLSPNRSWEFNVRQNGYDIAADAFGYPEAYYNPPMEAVASTTFLRGAAGLQYGPQFGGLLDYTLKRAPKDVPFTFESVQTAGTYGLFSSFNALGGNSGKLSYYGYFDHRTGDGWRENSEYRVQHGHLYLGYAVSSKLQLSAEYTRMGYLSQQPGGLTDAQFATDPRKSSRERNWFQVPWNIANLTAEYKPSKNFALTWKVFGLLADRNSVGFNQKITVADVPDPATGLYANRQVDRDSYKNIGTELRTLTQYNLFGQQHALSAGMRLYQASTLRRQQGKGDRGMDFNLDIEGRFARELDYQTRNAAFFVENVFHLMPNLTLTPGLRYELIENSMEGRMGIKDGKDVMAPSSTSSRQLLLAGIGAEYSFGRYNLYANISQAYRPVLFSDLLPPASTDVVDTNLKDASGYNADLGLRGQVGKALTFDVSTFYMHYENRIGTISRFVDNDPTKGSYQFRTNLGTTRHYGLEAYAELSLLKALDMPVADKSDLSVFVSSSLLNARYQDFKTAKVSGTAPNQTITEGNLKGNRVENAPEAIHRIGVRYAYKGFSATLQGSYVGEVYSDAGNTVEPNAEATTGKLPSYRVLDFSFSYHFLKHFSVKGGVNNLADARYATRRAGGYPGPGILPADGRNAYLSVGFKL